MKNESEPETFSSTPKVLIVGGGAAGLAAGYALALRGVEVDVLEFGPKPAPARQFLTDKWPDDLPLRGLGKGGMEYYCPVHFTPQRNAPYHFPNEVENSWLKRTRVAGGKTLYWTGHSLRFSDYEFQARAITGRGENWPLGYEQIAPYYSRAETLMGVTGSVERLAQQPDGIFLPPLDLRCGELILQETLRKMQIAMIPARKAILTVGHNARPACHYCGRCFLGCKTAAKFDAFTGLYYRARTTGKLRLRPNSVVLEVLSDDRGRASGVRYADRETRKVYTARASVIVLAASAIETARLLLNSKSPDGGRGLANSSGLVGRYLGESIGIRIEGLLPQLRNSEVFNADGSGEHGLIPRFVNLSDDLPREYAGGFLFLTQSGPEIFPSFAARLPGYGEALIRAARAWYPAPIRLYGVASVTSRRENRVVLDYLHRDDWGQPTAKVEFSFGDEDRQVWNAMAEHGQEFLEAAGAEYISVEQVAPENGGGLHASGTCRMGTDEKTTVVNAFGRTHDVKNLFVIDGAAFVSSLNQPTLTIIALALRSADFIADGLRRGDF